MLRGYKAIVKTSTRTRILGTCLVLLAAPTIWAGNSEESILATVLLFLGWAIVLASVPALVLFPRVYMSIAGGMLPDDATGTLFGWRLLGLVGMIIGVALFRAGMLAL